MQKYGVIVTQFAWFFKDFILPIIVEGKPKRDFDRYVRTIVKFMWKQRELNIGHQIDYRFLKCFTEQYLVALLSEQLYFPKFLGKEKG